MRFLSAEPYTRKSELGNLIVLDEKTGNKTKLEKKFLFEIETFIVNQRNSKNISYNSRRTMHTNNICAEQKSYVLDAERRKCPASAEYEECDFQPGGKKRSFPVLPTKPDYAQPASRAASVFVTTEMRDDNVKSAQSADQENHLRTARLDPHGVGTRQDKPSQSKPAEEAKTCRPLIASKEKENQGEQKAQSDSRVGLPNEMRKTVNPATETIQKNIPTPNIKILKSKGSKEVTGSKEKNSKQIAEGSIKTAMSISTITDQEAGKYSFLRVDKKKPTALVTNFDEPAGSDLELDLNTGIDNGKPNEPKLDMKNLEAFFKNAATASRPPSSKRTPKPASKTKSKPSSWRKKRSFELFKALRRGNLSSEKNEQKSSDGNKKTKRSRRTKRQRKKQSVLADQQPSTRIISALRTSKEKSKTSLRS